MPKLSKRVVKVNRVEQITGNTNFTRNLSTMAIASAEWHQLLCHGVPSIGVQWTRAAITFKNRQLLTGTGNCPALGQLPLHVLFCRGVNPMLLVVVTHFRLDHCDVLNYMDFCH